MEKKALIHGVGSGRAVAPSFVQERARPALIVERRTSALLDHIWGYGGRLGHTPILDALERHAKVERTSLHVPGHHSGRLFYDGLSPWLGQALRIDLTELPGLDNLHAAEGCILESERLTATHYGADATYFSVNGATACMMAAIRACVTPKRRRVILLGPCHVSVWRGLVHADAEPVWLPSPWRSDLQAFECPHPDALYTALKKHSHVACVVVTSPTYQGFVADVAGLAAACHDAGVPLVVDEAHGAHFGLHPMLPPHSVSQGADIVIQSPHKTLPCLTQAAWVHVTGDAARCRAVRDALSFLQTTSPSYLLLASLDAAQAWLTSGRDTVEATLATLAKFRELEPNRDPMRVWIPTGDFAASQRLADGLTRHGMFLEYADAAGALAIFGFGQHERELAKFFAVLRNWQESEAWPMVRRHTDSLEALYELGTSEHALCPRQVDETTGRMVPLAQAAGRVLKRAIAPYPPGVPALWPGQTLSGDAVAILMRLRATGQTLIGLELEDQIEVCDD